MGTRSIIVLKDKNEALRLYKHYDGYPTGVLPLLDTALRITGVGARTTAEHIVNAALAGKDRVQIEDQTRRFNRAFLGDQWDLEWIYVVDIAAKTINIYGGGYTGEAPQVAYGKGPVDPAIYADSLYEQYQDAERKKTALLVADLAAAGYTVNPPKAKRKAKAV